jgi:integrase
MLETLFSYPIFQPGGPRPAPAGVEASFWIPVLSLMLGTRAEELCGLVVDDVNLTDRYVNMCTGGGRRRLKNRHSVREIPLHPFLLDQLGFGDYVAAIKRRGSQLLFPDLARSKSKLDEDKLSARWSRWFGLFVNEKLKITDPGVTWHSMRHNYHDLVRAVPGVSDHHLDALTGHATPGMSSRYGSGFELETLRNIVDRIEIPSALRAVSRWTPSIASTVAAAGHRAAGWNAPSAGKPVAAEAAEEAAR